MSKELTTLRARVANLRRAADTAMFERDQAKAAALEFEARALNAERALEQLQDEVVTLRHLVAGSVPVAELRVALELTAREQRSDTLPDLARVIALVDAAEQRAAAAMVPDHG